jgi:secreted trypsin-like serine protease
MKKILSTTLLLSSLQLFAQTPAARIINGTEVQTNDPIAQSTVMLMGTFGNFSFNCTGSIIAKDLVVTAAHCLGPYGHGKLTAFFGVNKKKGGVTYKVTKQIMPDDYNDQLEFDRNDIALVLLEKPIPANYKPATLMDEAYELHPDDMVTLAGYGVNILDSKKKDDGLGVLRFAEQNILNPQYGNTEVLINIKNKGTCSGDSGGPAYIKKDGQLYLFGAASRMTAKDIVPGSKPVQYKCTEEIVYVNILKKMEWLKTAEAQLRQ